MYVWVCEYVFVFVCVCTLKLLHKYALKDTSQIRCWTRVCRSTSGHIFLSWSKTCWSVDEVGRNEIKVAAISRHWIHCLIQFTFPPFPPAATAFYCFWSVLTICSFFIVIFWCILRCPLCLGCVLQVGQEARLLPDKQMKIKWR